MKSCFQKLSTTCFTFFDFPKNVCPILGFFVCQKLCGPWSREGRSQTSRIGAASREVGSDRQNIFDLMCFHWNWCFLYFQSLLWISGWFVFLSPLHLETSPNPGRYTGSAKSGSFQLFKLGNFTIGRWNVVVKKSWKKTLPQKTNQTHPKNLGTSSSPKPSFTNQAYQNPRKSSSQTWKVRLVGSFLVWGYLDNISDTTSTCWVAGAVAATPPSQATSHTGGPQGQGLQASHAQVQSDSFGRYLDGNWLWTSYIFISLRNTPVMCGTLTFFWRVRRLPWKWTIALISIGWKWVSDSLVFVQIISEASFASGFLAEPSFHQILLRRWVVVRAIVTCRYAEVDGLWTLSVPFENGM